MTKLPEDVAESHDLQIRFLDSFGKSGASLFRSYRECKVLAVGAGSFLVSLVEALFESGLPKIHVTITDSEPTDWNSLNALAENARKKNPGAELKEIKISQTTESAWRESIQSFDWVLNVGKKARVDEIRAIHRACRAEKKSLLVATCVGQTGIAGPLVNSDSEGCWESAWRRLHRSALCKDAMTSEIRSAAGSMLANVIVSDMFRSITRVTKPELENRLYLLNLQTLEGSYHSFLPHPLITHEIKIQRVPHIDRLIGTGNCTKGDPGKFLSFIHRLTSPQSGIFHVWGEGNLNQLPLPQCRVQAVDPLSEGPAELLPVSIHAGLTHLEARKEAGLAGIEAYLTRIGNYLGADFLAGPKSGSKNAKLSEFVEIGAGESVEEAVLRGLQKGLTKELIHQTADRNPKVLGVRMSQIKDSPCRYYLRALTVLQGAPTIGLGDDLLGFPVVWIGSGDRWYGSVSLTRTLALRMALQQALLKAQNRTEVVANQGVELLTPDPEEAISTKLDIEAVQDTMDAELLCYAMSVLKRNRARLFIVDIKAEPIFNEHLGGLFGVRIGKAGASDE